MKPIFETEKGWTEAIISDDCEFDKFYRVADVLQNEFNLTFTNKLNDFDTLYWDFDYKERKLVLFYNTFEGIAIFPRAFKEATQKDNEGVTEIGTLLFPILIDLDWSHFEDGKTIGTKGSESGIIVSDIENSNGARITLEKDCGNIPFAITFGVYGLMFHTHYEGNEATATAYIADAKCKINKIFDLYDVPEERRNEFWQTKHDSQLNALAGITESTITESTSNSTNTKSEGSWWRKFLGLN